MFKKIHSETGKSALAEAWEALLPIIRQLLLVIKSKMTTYPKTTYLMMVLLFTFSALFNFLPVVNSTNKHREKDKNFRLAGEKLMGGLENISMAASGIRRNFAITGKIDSLLAKEKLSRADSIFLMEAFGKLKNKK